MRALVLNDLRLARCEPIAHAALLLVPLLVIGLLRSGARSSLILEGYDSATGSERVVPGMATLSAFLYTGNFGFSFFREHQWRTWDRLRTAAPSPAVLVAGKSVLPSITVLVLTASLFAVGYVGLDLRPAGSWLALAIIMVALSLTVVAMALAVVATASTVVQMNTLATLGVLVLSAIGGALSPVDALPRPVKLVAPSSPVYWAVQGFDEVVLDGAGVVDVLPEALALLAFSAAFTAVFTRRFRIDERKTGYA